MLAYFSRPVWLPVFLDSFYCDATVEPTNTSCRSLIDHICWINQPYCCKKPGNQLIWIGTYIYMLNIIYKLPIAQLQKCKGSPCQLVTQTSFLKGMSYVRDQRCNNININILNLCNPCGKNDKHGKMNTSEPPPQKKKNKIQRQTQSLWNTVFVGCF